MSPAFTLIGVRYWPIAVTAIDGRRLPHTLSRLPDRHGWTGCHCQLPEGLAARSNFLAFWQIRKSLRSVAPLPDCTARVSAAIYSRPRQHAFAPAVDATQQQEQGAVLSKP